MGNLPDNPLEFAVRRAASDPFFLGSLLSQVCRSRDLSPPALAGMLGCPAEALAKLYMCRAPRPSSPEFGEDVGRAAALARCNAVALATLVREAQAVSALRPDAAGNAAPRLLAARDREEELLEGEAGNV